MPSDPTPNAPAASIAAAFSNLPAVIAVALAGSGLTGATDQQSDLDFYVYAEAPVAMADRVAIATRFATHREVGNDFWEPGDEWIDSRSGRQIDVMYRTPVWIEEQLAGSRPSRGVRRLLDLLLAQRPVLDAAV
jgi:predicted nucleotidyltransferase